MFSTCGLLYLRARYYDPALGTFLSKDPVVGQVGGMSIRWNAYAYAGNNPVNYVDPDGRFFFMALAFAAAGAILAGAIDVASQLHENGNRIECLNGQRVGLAMLEGLVMGAVSGMMAGLTAGMGMTGLFAAVPSMAMDFIAGATWDMLVHGKSQEDAIMGGIANVAFGAVLDVASKPLMNAMGSVARTAADAIAESNPWRNVKNAAREPKGIFGRIKDFFNRIGNTDRGRFFRESKGSLQNLAEELGITFEQLNKNRFSLAVSRLLDDKEMRMLTKAYGNEFFLEVRLGDGDIATAKATAQIWLTRGSKARVGTAAPFGETGRWIDFGHTHPNNVGYVMDEASETDMDSLIDLMRAQAEYYAKMGYDPNEIAPQTEARIIPEYGSVFKYTTTNPNTSKY